MIEKLYERLTGRPYFTTVCMSEEFGPPPAVEFAAELAGLSDTRLVLHGDEIVARARGRRWVEQLVAEQVVAGGGR